MISQHILTMPEGTLHLTWHHARHVQARGALLMWPDMRSPGHLFEEVDQGAPGLAPWLAEQGFDVAVMDQRGQGHSTPHSSRRNTLTLSRIITEDIPAALEGWSRLSSRKKTHVLAHGWGGVLTASCMARFPELRKCVLSQIFLGSRRTITTDTTESRHMLARQWGPSARFRRMLKGYMPAGYPNSIDEALPALQHQQHYAWIRRTDWLDDDGFDYRRALIRGGMPPTLHVAGEAEKANGHPADVAGFRDECGPHQGEFAMLGPGSGLARAYTTREMLLHPDARHEVYPRILQWLDEV
ncbi:alpha/beta fold hydrolase [Larsenimonas rhizosphaerae]|uniref:Alpha/beta fold hydrolase n=1 Tax=Larsenimonas rhizosphaerae TaxID=2944682 RepID=A0AA42CT93_9GAMM|nr:alpha/beta fold hydrolase [Larsenimonas rhizosphaerae]MCX2522831.1 alpha/beta fold hydrolase [Larsenimonas rhizosphaerae]